MQERPWRSVTLIACGLASSYSPPCSIVSKRRPAGVKGGVLRTISCGQPFKTAHQLHRGCLQSSELTELDQGKMSHMVPKVRITHRELALTFEKISDRCMCHHQREVTHVISVERTVAEVLKFRPVWLGGIATGISWRHSSSLHWFGTKTALLGLLHIGQTRRISCERRKRVSDRRST
jgi:hypothetical protein